MRKRKRERTKIPLGAVPQQHVKAKSRPRQSLISPLPLPMCSRTKGGNKLRLGSC